jgi:CheY-like chemotaxis protein
MAATIDRGARRTDRPARVLVVDDHPATRQLTELVLRDAGYDVRQAEDGAAALEIVRDWRPALVVTDIFMDRMDGVDLILAIRRHGSPTKVIAVSAGWQRRAASGTTSPPDVLEDAVAAGADATLFKPIDRAALVETVARLLSDR